jgi:hypothetical protein
MQILGLCSGLVKIMTSTIYREYKLIPSVLVGLSMGTYFAFLWFRQLQIIKSTTEEQWNKAWYMSPRTNI